MKKYFGQFYKFSISFLLLSIWWACATTGVLTGGPRDETPPVLIEERSSPNFQTNRTERSFYLEFDEYVKVEDVFNQIVVSPPLVYNPKVEARSRRIRFEFNEREKLRDSTTYSIQFGEAIRDLNEGNKAEGIRFVFSTGDIIDSLNLSGIIVDAITGEPVEKALALLYDSSNDSAVIKDRPYYFGRSDKSGKFSIENIRPGTFQLVGLKEENNNYKYDDPKEWIGYFDEMLVMDTAMPEIRLPIFQERKKGFVENIDSTSKGLIKIRYSEDLFLPKLSWKDSLVEALYFVEGKEIQFWHKATDRTRWWLYIEQGDGKKDSIRIRSYPMEAEMTKQALSCKPSDRKRNTFHKDSTFHFGFNIPVRIEQKSAFEVRDDLDTSWVGQGRLIDLPEGKELNWSFSPLKKAGKLNLEIPAEHVVDWYGRMPDSSLICSIKLEEPEVFSNLFLSIKGFDSEMNYVLRLLQKEKIVREWKLSETETWEGSFMQLKPDEYQIWILEDANNNGRWDAGRFLERRQPERKKILKVSDLRANWDIEQEMDVSDWYKEPEPELDEDIESTNEEEEESDETDENDETSEGGN